jgi:2-oxoglutarate ferredoxin oxidoreductase subunit alpha
MALGAAFGGALGVTATSGPGMDLKTETIGLAVMLELPLSSSTSSAPGPSTGMPTKTEQSDLLMALYGRHGESPLPVSRRRTPAQCFDAVFEAARIAISYRTPVILLLRPLPRQLVASRGGSRRAELPRSTRPSHEPPARHRSCPTTRDDRWRGRGRSRATEACSTASAGWRRPTARRHLLRRRQPRSG